jgi:hypothetical protein
MTTPASAPNDPSKLKKSLSGRMDNSASSRISSTTSSSPQIDPPTFGPTDPRYKFLPAFWTIASVISITVNIVLVVILLVQFQMLSALQTSATDQVSGLLSGLYSNFEKLDQANIRTNIHIESQIPVQLNLNANGPITATISNPVVIDGALVSMQMGGINITNARATIVLPEGAVLPLNIEGLTIPVEQSVLAVLDVPVDVPLNQTELHDPLVGFQNVLKPWYCLAEPNAISIINGLPICSPTTDPIPLTPKQ